VSTIATSPTVSTADDIRELVIVAARAADDKKADDVIILDVGETLAITDAFLIASAGNPRLVATIADSIEAAVKAAGGPGPIATEGLEEASWVLLDFGGFVVHVFLEETRRYYDLERLWADAPKIEWRDSAHPVPGNAPALSQFS
jgi:ribosome-associated protein